MWTAKRTVRTDPQPLHYSLILWLECLPFVAQLLRLWCSIAMTLLRRKNSAVHAWFHLTMAVQVPESCYTRPQSEHGSSSHENTRPCFVATSSFFRFYTVTQCNSKSKSMRGKSICGSLINWPYTVFPVHGHSWLFLDIFGYWVGCSFAPIINHYQLLRLHPS